MDQIFPTPVDGVDIDQLLANEARPAPPDRPWVLANMISTVDGAIAIDGVSGGLGGPADKRMFAAIRSVPDVILVGSSTVIAENYRRPQTSDTRQARRLALGQEALPRIAIVSASLSIDPAHRVFDPEARPMIITHDRSPLDRRAALAEVADIVIAGDEAVDLKRALELLRADGANTVLLEGGPTLNGAMAHSDLVDEWLVSRAPVVVGGSGPRMTAGNHTPKAQAVGLDRILHEDGFLFHRYLRERP